MVFRHRRSVAGDKYSRGKPTSLSITLDYPRTPAPGISPVDLPIIICLAHDRRPYLKRRYISICSGDIIAAALASRRAARYEMASSPMAEYGAYRCRRNFQRRAKYYFEQRELIIGFTSLWRVTCVILHLLLARRFIIDNAASRRRPINDVMPSMPQAARRRCRGDEIKAAAVMKEAQNRRMYAHHAAAS